MDMTLSQVEIEAFQRDGAVCLRGVFEEKWLESARISIEKTLKNPSQYRYDIERQENR